MANKHLKLGDALFGEEGAEGEASVERRAIDNGQGGVTIEAKFEEGHSGRSGLEFTKGLGRVVSDCEGVRDSRHEHCEVGDPGIPFAERTRQKALRVFCSSVGEFFVGGFHLHIDGQPVSQITVGFVKVVVRNRVGGERGPGGKGKRRVNDVAGDKTRTTFRVETPTCDIIETFGNVEETTRGVEEAFPSLGVMLK